MIIQRKVNIVTSNKTLDYSEIGDVICEGSLTLNLPNPRMGLWYTFRQVTYHTTTVAGTQIKLNEEVTFIADDSTWYMTKGGSSGEPSAGGSIPLATITNDGLMASTDKQLLADLDSIAHEHGNISVIEELSDIGGSLAYLGEVVGGSSAPGLKLLTTTSDFTVTSTTMSDVSQLAFTMEAGKSYKIDVVLRYRGAATTTGGKFGFYSQSPGYCFITGFLEGAITSAAAATALQVPIRVCYNKGDADSFITTTGVNSTSKDHIIHGTCYIVCEDTGVFQPCWGSEVANSGATLMAGSMLSYQEVS